MSVEYERLKATLRKRPTPETMREAAQRFREYQQTKGAGKSKPTLVSLGFGKKYPTSVRVEDIPAELERNPAFFEHMREFVEED